MPGALDAAWLLAHPRKGDGSATTAADVKFPERVLMGVIRTAKTIRSGDVAPTSGKESLYAKRQQLAVAVLAADPAPVAARFVDLLATLNVITDASDDAALVNQIGNNWNAVAGVWAQEGAVT